MADEYEATYGDGSGGTVIGGSSSYDLEEWDFRKTHTRANFTGRVVVAHQTEATFISLCDALEAAWTKERQRLRLKLGSGDEFDYDPATNSGFNQRAEIEKIPEGASARSRLYRVSVEVELPEDTTDQFGRRTDASIDIRHDASTRRRITFSGTYTAQLGALNAREQFEDRFPLYAAAFQTALDVTAEWDEISKDVQPDDSNKNCTYSVVREEILLDQKIGTKNDLDLISPSLELRQITVGPGDYPGASRASSGGSTDTTVRLKTIEAIYSTAVDKTRTTDLVGKWNADIRPWIIRHVRDVFQPAQIALVEQDFKPDKTSNSIAANLTFQITGGQTILEYEVSFNTSIDDGWIFRPAWAASRHAKYRFPGIANKTHTIRIRALVIGRIQGIVEADPLRALGGASVPRPSGPNWTRVSLEPDVKPTQRGIGDLFFDTTDVALTEVYQYHEPPDGEAAEIAEPGSESGTSSRFEGEAEKTRIDPKHTQRSST